MANLAKIIRDIIRNALNLDESTQLHETMKSFADVLIHDMTKDQFADMYAQTISYGMFAARVNHNIGKSKFERMTAGYDLPKTNPFLRQLFNTIGGTELDDRVTWAVDELANLLHHSAMESILKDFGKRTRQEDPVVHFYETFLAAYDPKLRESRGVYYTPEPVVSYIVRSVDHILKTEFNLPKGLADSSKIKTPSPGTPGEGWGEGGELEDLHKVLILDPACGTGTFLHGVIDQIHENFKGNEGAWDSYVSEHLLPRIFGFELLMAPYAVAHLKLGLQLKEYGYDFKSDERLRVYLTNTLEEAFHSDEKLPLTNWLAKEANAANEVKRDLPIMVVLGNPPYSGHSANASWREVLNPKTGKSKKEATWIGKLIQDYYYVDGNPLGEKNSKWLQDDYVKFIRFAQWRIQETGYGVLAFISNHGYLDNPTFRGMRQSLMKTFDDIYILDLHGNSKKKEKAPDGGKDENVFDIQQGVAIGIFVKRKLENKKDAVIKHAHLFGLRDSKYKILWDKNISSIKWSKLKPELPFYLFTTQDIDVKDEYNDCIELTKLMRENSLGIISKRDNLAVAFDEVGLTSKIKYFIDKQYSDQEISDYFEIPLRDKDKWDIGIARKKIGLKLEKGYFQKLLYRPFDIRQVYYNSVLVARTNTRIMHNLEQENYAIVVGRQGIATSSDNWDLLYIANSIADQNIFRRGGGTVFPLYLYPDTSKKDLFSEEAHTGSIPVRTPNLSAEFIAEMEKRLGMKFIPDGSALTPTLSRSTGRGSFSPEDVFYYMYAVFHSPTYRSRYAEFLKIDFPRLPLTSNVELFRKLCKFGEELVKLHLMEEPHPNPLLSTGEGVNLVKFPKKDSDVVEFVKYEEAGGSPALRVQINADQYFEGVTPEVWNFHIGGYQVAHKWLKDRKGRKLSYDDIEHYQNIISALSETMRLMKEIDEVIKEAGGFPLK